MGERQNNAALLGLEIEAKLRNAFLSSISSAAFQSKMSIRLDTKQNQVVVCASGVALAVAAVQAYRVHRRRQKGLKDLRDNPFLRDCRKPPPATKIEPED